jgi:G:T-mismatch repair DNA endonuclease (very short patch repair protein)
MLGKDKFTPAGRSAIMARVRSWNTNPERIVRSTLHKLGYRYRLHDSMYQKFALLSARPFLNQ